MGKAFEVCPFCKFEEIAAFAALTRFYKWSILKAHKTAKLLPALRRASDAQFSKRRLSFMSIFNEPEFQALVRKAKTLRIWCYFRCVYSWIMVLGPIALLNLLFREDISVLAAWCCLIGSVVMLVWGIVVWCKAINFLMAPAHKALLRFNKEPNEKNLRWLCACIVSVRKEKRHPKGDYDLMRRAHTIASRDTQTISRELFDFYTTILRACNVAAI